MHAIRLLILPLLMMFYITPTIAMQLPSARNSVQYEPSPRITVNRDALTTAMQSIVEQYSVSVPTIITKNATEKSLLIYQHRVDTELPCAPLIFVVEIIPSHAPGWIQSIALHKEKLYVLTTESDDGAIASITVCDLSHIAIQDQLDEPQRIALHGQCIAFIATCPMHTISLGTSLWVDIFSTILVDDTIIAVTNQNNVLALNHAGRLLHHDAVPAFYFPQAISNGSIISCRRMLEDHQGITWTTYDTITRTVEQHMHHNPPCYRTHEVTSAHQYIIQTVQHTTKPDAYVQIFDSNSTEHKSFTFLNTRVPLIATHNNTLYMLFTDKGTIAMCDMNNGGNLYTLTLPTINHLRDIMHISCGHDDYIMLFKKDHIHATPTLTLYGTVHAHNQSLSQLLSGVTSNATVTSIHSLWQYVVRTCITAKNNILHFLFGW